MITFTAEQLKNKALVGRFPRSLKSESVEARIDFDATGEWGVSTVGGGNHGIADLDYALKLWNGWFEQGAVCTLEDANSDLVEPKRDVNAQGEFEDMDVEVEEFAREFEYVLSRIETLAARGSLHARRGNLRGVSDSIGLMVSEFNIMGDIMSSQVDRLNS